MRGCPVTRGLSKNRGSSHASGTTNSVDGVVDRVRAECDIARRFAGLESVPRLEPLPVAVDQADQPDRHAADAERDAGEVLVGLFGRGVEYPQLAQLGHAPVFARRNRWLDHVEFPLVFGSVARLSVGSRCLGLRRARRRSGASAQM